MLPPRPLARELGAGLVAFKAGKTPNITLESTARSALKISTVKFRWRLASWIRTEKLPCGGARKATRGIVQYARATPIAPPVTPKSKLSVSS